MVIYFSDDERKAKEAALNELEAYIYKVKNRIIDDEDQLKLVSTDEQRQEVRERRVLSLIASNR